MRFTLAALPALVGAVLLGPSVAGAEPALCNEVSCVPGITPQAVLGAPCGDPQHYVFGTTSWGRLVFCASPRRYEPRFFRSPSMAGVRAENSACAGFENWVAQAPDGLFLTCLVDNAEPRWVRGDV